MKRISIDDTFTENKFNKVVDITNYEIYKPGKYIACIYDDTWHIGLVLECSEENQDCNVKFMSRKDLNLH